MADILDDDPTVIQRILDHIDNNTTDVLDEVWREPVANYTSPERYQGELTKVMRRTATPFCPSAAIPEPGCYVARDAAQTPLVAVRGQDGVARVFLNACRHRGAKVVSDGVGRRAGAVRPMRYGLCNGRFSAVGDPDGATFLQASPLSG